MNDRVVTVDMQCWKCPLKCLATGPTLSAIALSMEELGWQEKHGVTWCPDCWRMRLPSERSGLRKSRTD